MDAVKSETDLSCCRSLVIGFTCSGFPFLIAVAVAVTATFILLITFTAKVAPAELI